MTHRRGFETLDSEIEVDELQITGEVPDWLDGRLLRTGPAQFEVGDQTYNHWFDGHAMLHAFRFADGRVAYANRFLESGSRKDARREGRIVRSEFGTDPCKSIFGRVMQLFSRTEPTDNANVNIAEMADEFVAMTETPMPVAFDPETLETRGHFEYDDELDGDITTAHPLYDAERRAMYNYMTRFGRTSTYRLYCQPTDGRTREVVAEIDVDPPRYMHSFGMSENFLVLVEFPYLLRPLEILLKDEPLARLFDWEPERGTRIRVVDKRTGEVTGTGTTGAVFAFHHVNAWEDEESGELVVDLAAYDDPTIVDELHLDSLRAGDISNAAGELRRFRLRPNGSNLRGEVVGDRRLELPRINEARRGRDYQFVWGNGRRDESGFLDDIVKIDVASGESASWHEPDCYPGEPVFVPRPDAEAEDDGVLLSVVLDGSAERSFLLVLDAATLDEIGRASVPHHIPFGFHGQYSTV